MEILIPIVLPILVWIFLYKYLVNKKLLPKWRAHLLSFIVFALVFIVSLILVVDKPKEDNQTSNIIKEIQEEKSNEIEQKEAIKEVDEFIKNKSLEESKKPIISITSNNMKNVIKSLEDNYNIIPIGWDYKALSDNNICFHDKSCTIYANKVQIQGLHKSIEALTSSQVNPKIYQQVCSAIMISLTGANKELVEQHINQYFNYASLNGRSKWEALGIEVTISPDSQNLLGCSFFKK